MPGLALNEDDSHFFYTRAGKALTEGDVDALVDQYAGTQVSHLLFCPNAMRASYASKVWDPIWRGYDPEAADDQPLLASTTPEGRTSARRWIHTAWALDQAGIDVYARWLARSRQHSISPWLSMRMNDVHNVDDERSYIHSEFWREHPEYRRVPYHFNAWTDRALDYGRSEVREHHFKLVEELAERYDFDGFELDWMRFGFHFRPGYETEGQEILTAFTQDVRRLLDGWEKRRGHRIRLGARVPSRPQTALGLGMDAASWAKKGLVDWLVITPFWATAEPDMPVETWRQMLAGSGVELLAGLEILLRPYPESKLFQTNSLETARSAALSLLQRGADRIYLFNYMDSETTLDNPSEYAPLLREIGDVKQMASRPRRHILTFSDTSAVGEAPAAALPAHVPAGGWRTFRLHIGPRPDQAAAWVILAFDTMNGAVGDAADLRINGELCTTGEAVNLVAPYPEGAAWRYRAPLTALKAGYNVIEIEAHAALTITWVEMAINLINSISLVYNLSEPSIEGGHHLGHD